VFHPRKKQDFSILHSVQTDIWPHTASYPIGMVAPSLGVKWLGRESDHSPPSIAKVKKVEQHLHSLHALMAYFLIN
jgi:hypothetical protein